MLVQPALTGRLFDVNLDSIMMSTTYEPQQECMASTSRADSGATGPEAVPLINIHAASSIADETASQLSEYFDTRLEDFDNGVVPQAIKSEPGKVSRWRKLKKRLSHLKESTRRSIPDVPDRKIVFKKVKKPFFSPPAPRVLQDITEENENEDYVNAVYNLRELRRRKDKTLPAHDLDPYEITARSTALVQKKVDVLDQVFEDSIQAHERILAESVQVENDFWSNQVTSCLDRVCEGFSKIKPLTVMVILRTMLDGTSVERMTAFGAMLEYLDIAYSQELCLNTYKHVVQFFMFMNRCYSNALSSLIEQQDSPLEALEEVFGFDMPAIPEEGIKMVSAAVGLATMLTGGSISFATARNKDFSSFVSGLGNLTKATTGMAQTVNIFKDILMWLLTNCGFKFKHSETIQVKIDEVSTFVDHLEERVEECAVNPYKLFDGSIDANNLAHVAKGHEDWYLAANKDGKLRTSQHLYTRIVTARNSLTKVVKTVDENLGSKQVPVVLWLWGRAGVGKSTALQQIIEELEALEGKNLTVYTRATSDKYWSGYKQQDLVVFDDFGSDPDVKDDANELMKACTVSSYEVNMAALNEKGTMFKSRYVLICSNYDTAPNAGTHFGAIERRRDFAYQVWNGAVSDFQKRTKKGIQEFQEWDKFLPNITLQRYRYTTTESGEVDSSSAIINFGDALCGLQGLKQVAKLVFDKQVGCRAGFIALLKRRAQQITASFHVATDSTFPGISKNDLVVPTPVVPPAVPTAATPGAGSSSPPDPTFVKTLIDGQVALLADRPNPNVEADKRRAAPTKRRSKPPAPKRKSRARRPPFPEERTDYYDDDGYDFYDDQPDDMHWHRSDFQDEHKVPKIFWFFGDVNTGKTVLAQQLVATEGHKVLHFDDALDDPDKFLEFTTQIKDIADEGHPCVITVNTDQHNKYFSFLKKQGSDMYERTIRRIIVYKFSTRRRWLGLGGKLTVDEVKVGNFENNVKIYRWDVPSNSVFHGTELIARTSIIDHFREILVQNYISHFEEGAMSCIDLPAKVVLDFHNVSLISRPTPAQLFKILGFSGAKELFHLRHIVNMFFEQLKDTAFNDTSLEGIARQVNQVRLLGNFPETIKITFMEGTFYLASIAGLITAGIANERELVKHDGALFFRSDGREVKLTQRQQDFHRLFLGEKMNFEDCYIPVEAIPKGELPLKYKIRTIVDKVLSYVTVVFSSGLIVANFMEISDMHAERKIYRNKRFYLPERPLRETGAHGYEEEWDDIPAYDPNDEWGDCQPLDFDDTGDFVETIWGDEFYVKRKTAGGKKLVRSKFKCKCSSGYDCALCNGCLPKYITVEGKKYIITPDVVPQTFHIAHESEVSRSKLPPRATVESAEITRTPNSKPLRVESITKTSTPKVTHIKVESAAEVEGLNMFTAQLYNKQRDSDKLMSRLLDEEKYHLTDDDRLWCPKRMNVGKKHVPGGTQISHHKCRLCMRLCLKLWNHDNYRERCCYGCKGYKMPDNYYHDPCDECKTAIKQQGCVDTQLRDIMGKCNSNTIQFVGFSGMMLHSNIGVGPGHCFYANTMRTRDGLNAKVIGTVKHKDLVFFQLLGKNDKPISSYPDIRKFLMPKGASLPIKQMGVLALDVGGSSFLAPVDLVAQVRIKPLGTKEDQDCIQMRMSASSSFTSFISRAGDCGSPLYKLDPTDVHKLIGIHVAGSDGFGYVAHVTQQDVPGMVPEEIVHQGGLLEELIEENINLYYGAKADLWCPMVNADGSDPNPLSHFCSECHKQVLSLSKKSGGKKNICYNCEGAELDPLVYYHDKKVCLLCVSSKEQDSPEYYALPTQQIVPDSGEIGTMKVIGRTVDMKGNSSHKILPGKTKLRPSPFRTDVFGKPYEPAIMSKHDPRAKGEDPYIKNVDKWDRERPPQDQDELYGLAEEMGHWFAHEINKAKIPVFKLTLEEAINRTTSIQKSNPIYMHSSAGYPYSTLPGVKNKAPMLFFDEVAGRYKIDRNCYEGWLLGRHVEYIISNAKLGRKTACVFDVNLKDEALPPQKIEDVKTRSIVGSPLCFTLAHRQYFHTCGAAIMELCDITPIKIGIAPNTLQWDRLYKYLTKNTEYGIDGDYKHWDASVSAEEIRAAGRFYNTIYLDCDPNVTPEDTRVRSIFYDMLAKPLINRGGTIVQPTGGIVSGEPLTGIDNSSINTMKIWRAWRHFVDVKNLGEHMKSFRAFMDAVQLAANGDDCNILPREEYKDFNFEFIRDFMKTLGAEYTPANKEDSTQEFKHITDMTFLKRHFLLLKEASPYCSGGLVDAAFNKMTSNCKVKKSAPYQDILHGVEYDHGTIGQTAETYLIEASLRGIEFYKRAVTHVVGVSREYNIDIPYPEQWKRVFNSVYHSYRTEWVDVFL